MIIIKITLFLFLFFSLLCAQQSDSTRVFQADTIRVSSEKDMAVSTYNQVAFKIPLPVLNTPVSVGVITKKVIIDQNAIVLSDALKNLSSINIQNNLGTQEYFLIRGFESGSSGLVLTDGTHEPDVSHFRFFGYGFYDLYNIEHVEVLKGPGAFLYGINTLSGAINMVKKQPAFTNFIRQNFSYGSYDSYRFSFDANTISADSTYALRINSFVNAFNHFRENKYSKNYALNPSISFKIDNHRFFNMNFEFIKSKLIPDTGIPLYIKQFDWELPDINPMTSYQSDYDFLDREIFRLRFDYNHFYSPRYKFRNKTFYTFLRGSARLTLPHFPKPLTTSSWIVERHSYLFNEMQFYGGNQSELLISFDKNSVIENILLGFEISKLYNNSKNALGLLNTVFLSDPALEFGSHPDPFDFNKVSTNAHSLNLAPFFVSKMNISGSTSLFLGGRYDYLNFSSDRYNKPFDYNQKVLVSRPRAVKQTFNKFSPMIGLLYQDSENLSFYTNYGKSFAQGLRVTDDPENSIQFELGYKYVSSDKKFRNNVAVYILTKENITIPLQSPLSGDKHANNGIQNSSGIEFEFSAQLFRSFYAILNYSYTAASFKKYNIITTNENLNQELMDYSRNIPPFVPAHLLNFWLNKNFLRDFSLGFGCRYTGEQYVHPENRFETRDYFLINVALLYSKELFQAGIHFKNITDQSYLTRGLGPFTVIPANPRSVTVTMGFRFN